MTIENNPAAAAIENIEKLMQVITDAQTASTGMAEKMIKVSTAEKLDINQLEHMGKLVDTYA